jgi:hypothetical protein
MRMVAGGTEEGCDDICVELGSTGWKWRRQMVGRGQGWDEKGGGVNVIQIDLRY